MKGTLQPLLTPEPHLIRHRVQCPLDAFVQYVPIEYTLVNNGTLLTGNAILRGSRFDV
ncbi:hypothetical protein J6590_045856 [Homalodisca vitripennis]|nr:hypothetical protein J6590_045856 [Homalodisca vitripennis]